MSLEEEVDSLRVQASQDAATIHELRVSLEQEREGEIDLIKLLGEQLFYFYLCLPCQYASTLKEKNLLP